MFDHSNRIILTGAVFAPPVYDHSVLGEGFFKMYAAAKRLSGTEDVLPVTVSERLLGENEYDEGAPISVSGQIRSYNQRSDDGSHLILTVFARELLTPADAEDANEAELIGHIVKPVIYRMTPFSREIADMLIAVKRRYGKSDYLPAIAWGRNARFAGTLTPGELVSVRGRMQSRRYQKILPDGGTLERTAYEISCSSIERQGY